MGRHFCRNPCGQHIAAVAHAEEYFAHLLRGFALAVNDLRKAIARRTLQIKLGVPKIKHRTLAQQIHAIGNREASVPDICEQFFQ